MSRRIAITGGPGSGKTTLINHLENQGYVCMHEISRAITLEAQKQGISQLFLKDPLLFSRKLLEGRLMQFKQGKEFKSEFIFYDRGMPDVTAYMDYIGTDYPPFFFNTCHVNRYDVVFLLPPWKAIYQQDNERYESYVEARLIYSFLRKGYEKYGYQIIEVPTGTLEERTDFILTNLKEKK